MTIATCLSGSGEAGIDLEAELKSFLEAKLMLFCMREKLNSILIRSINRGEKDEGL